MVWIYTILSTSRFSQASPYHSRWIFHNFSNYPPPTPFPNLKCKENWGRYWTCFMLMGTSFLKRMVFNKYLFWWYIRCAKFSRFSEFPFFLMIYELGTCKKAFKIVRKKKTLLLRLNYTDSTYIWGFLFIAANFS